MISADTSLLPTPQLSKCFVFADECFKCFESLVVRDDGYSYNLWLERLLAKIYLKDWIIIWFKNFAPDLIKWNIQKQTLETTFQPSKDVKHRYQTFSNDSSGLWDRIEFSRRNSGTNPLDYNFLAAKSLFGLCTPKMKVGFLISRLPCLVSQDSQVESFGETTFVTVFGTISWYKDRGYWVPSFFLLFQSHSGKFAIRTLLDQSSEHLSRQCYFVPRQETLWKDKTVPVSVQFEYHKVEVRFARLVTCSTETSLYFVYCFDSWVDLWDNNWSQNVIHLSGKPNCFFPSYKHMSKRISLLFLYFGSLNWYIFTDTIGRLCHSKRVARVHPVLL